MANTRGFARLGILAVGLGVTAAVAHSPLASADSSNDLLSTIDSLLSGWALPAASSSTDMAISYDGMSLVQEGNATADTIAGQYGFAIAEGSGAYAYAGGGVGDVAEADGTNAFALAGGEPGDTDANYDKAIDMGNNDLPSTGARDGAYAGNGDLGGGSGTGSDDTAIDIGNNTNGASGGGNEGAFAGAGGLGGIPGDGNNDTAIDVGNNSGALDSTNAIGGDNNYASQTGDMNGFDEGSFAGYGGNDNISVADDSYTRDFAGAYAQVGSNNYAYLDGPENSFAVAYDGNNNVAIVDDPSGSAPSYSDSGYGFNSDVAEVLGTSGTANAVDANDVYEIITALGIQNGTF